MVCGGIFCCCASIQTVSNCFMSCLTVCSSKTAKIYNYVLLVLCTLLAIVLQKWGDKMTINWAGVEVFFLLLIKFIGWLC